MVNLRKLKNSDWISASYPKKNTIKQNLTFIRGLGLTGRDLMGRDYKAIKLKNLPLKKAQLMMAHKKLMKKEVEEKYGKIMVEHHKRFPKKVEREVSLFYKYKGCRAEKIWMMLNFQMWAEKWYVN